MENRRLWAWLTLALASVVANRYAAAQTSDVSIHWHAPPLCSSGATVRERVIGLAGRGVAIDGDIVVTGAKEDLRATVRVKIGETMAGERRLTASTCEELAESVAVVLALSAMAPPPPAPPAPAAPDLPQPVRPAEAPLPVPPPTQTVPAAARESSHAPARALARPVVRIAVLASADVGTLPTPTAGVGLELSVLVARHLTLGLAGDIWLSQDGTATSAPINGQGASFSLLTADAIACYALPLHLPVELSPCALGELGHISATARDTQSDTPTSAFWFALGVGGTARWEITRFFALALALDAVVPTAHETFSIATSSGGILQGHTFHSVGYVTGRGYFGPELRF